MSRILFVVPMLKSMFGDPKTVPGHPHTGIAYLSGFLKQHSVEVTLFDEGVDRIEELEGILKKETFDLIGVTAFSYSLRYVYNMVARLKQYSSAPVVVGGPHISVTHGDILTKTRADFAIQGEGEWTTLELLTELGKSNPDFSGINGLIWRNQKEIVENRERETIQDLDVLPYPDYESFGLEKYPCFRHKALPMITQRGCPYKCNFCSVPLSMGSPFRARTPENVVQELEYWYEKGWRHFPVNDDVFNIRRGRVMEICKLIVDRGLKITWELYNGIRVNVCDRELLEAMKAAGCVFISYGCESGNPEILKIIQKGLTLDQVRRAVQLTAEAGIKCSVNFIIGHPTETYEKAMDSIRFALSLPATFVNFYNDTPYPGTTLYEWTTKNATFLHPDFLEDISYRSGEPIYVTPEFSREERIKIMKMGYRLYERRVLQYRLGRWVGLFAYFFSRIPIVHKMGRYAVYNSKVGQHIFQKLSQHLGGMVWLKESKL